MLLSLILLLLSPASAHLYGCSECPEGWVLQGDECVFYHDFERQGWSDKDLDFSGFNGPVDVAVDVKLMSIDGQNGSVRLGFEEKGQVYGFVQEWAYVKADEINRVKNLFIYRNLEPREYDFEAKQEGAKAWTTVRALCKVEDCPACVSYQGSHPETCTGVQTQHGLWLSKLGGSPVAPPNLWTGPRPLVVPAEFAFDNGTLNIVGVVKDDDRYFKYEFDLWDLKKEPYDSSITNSLGGCELLNDEHWEYFHQFNGTLTNLISGESWPLLTRSYHVPQVGCGANLFNHQFGVSFWFKIPDTNIIGDLNLDIACVSSLKPEMTL